MARYYEESALIELIKNKQLIFEENTPVDEAIASQIDAVVEGIGELPTADVVPRAEFDALRGRLAEEEQIRESLEGFIRHELEKEKKKAVVETLHELERRTEQLADELKYEEIKLEPCTCGKLPKLKIMHNIMMGHGSFDDLILYECPKCGKQADGAAGTELKSRIRAKNNWNNMLLAEAPKGGADNEQREAD